MCNFISKMTDKKDLNLSDYIIAFLSFIPLLGLLFGIISIIFGFTKKSNLLKILGILGILFTIILYSGLFYFGFKTESSYENWNVFTKNNLNKTFIFIEYYKTQNQTYPDSLNYLKEYDEFSSFIDLPKGNEFFYQKVSDSTYYFFGIGKDEKPFTEDDLYPSLSKENLKQSGLIKK